MLLGKPWFIDAKVTHDWGNNVITVQDNGTIRTILINKKLGVETKRPQVLVCYDLMEELINEEKDLIFEIELFSIGTITSAFKINNFIVECWSVKNHKH
jgi:hypothetical protein